MKSTHLLEILVPLQREKRHYTYRFPNLPDGRALLN